MQNSLRDMVLSTACYFAAMARYRAERGGNGVALESAVLLIASAAALRIVSPLGAGSEK
jgi:hypothetical protein